MMVEPNKTGVPHSNAKVSKQWTDQTLDKRRPEGMKRRRRKKAHKIESRP